ncbi:hypothetical protein BOWSER_32 [Gordonia phage Bowser]|uniref:Uncharacterized protein n=1 Tax=Gordonia phage Bowser TaxID=1838063 RepID=A0A166Y369_9CAUD|nr:hypothetical protein BH770_gp32 [Gordonia phage Bowser]ANA85427.1 hypothetical protein BOWSER_32 [Gordonia phage Bowser]
MDGSSEGPNWRRHAASRHGCPDDVQMDHIFNEIRAAVNGNAWILALFGTLAIPDICAALGSPNGKTTGEKYRRWIYHNLRAEYPQLDPAELWQMRCSMLHQGSSKTATYARVIFVAPFQGNVFHNNVINDALNLDLPTFCADVISAGERWYAANQHVDHVAQNLESLVRWHDNGLPPYIVGAPVLS